eukprot:TRINITY_DN1846_c0_g1_i1.p1 TRINITY_DN1846_c0_g1~~TRINITY_DN1846_c0_g1_i1.p1  ORF type:complete len:232 (+),score=80.78 TRINITY_DN1846_c0_g1_i1:71-766(+)
MGSISCCEQSPVDKVTEQETTAAGVSTDETAHKVKARRVSIHKNIEEAKRRLGLAAKSIRSKHTKADEEAWKHVQAEFDVAKLTWESQALIKGEGYKKAVAAVQASLQKAIEKKANEAEAVAALDDIVKHTDLCGKGIQNAIAEIKFVLSKAKPREELAVALDQASSQPHLPHVDMDAMLSAAALQDTAKNLCQNIKTAWTVLKSAEAAEDMVHAVHSTDFTREISAVSGA